MAEVAEYVALGVVVSVADVAQTYTVAFVEADGVGLVFDGGVFEFLHAGCGGEGAHEGGNVVGEVAYGTLYLAYEGCECE